MRTPLYSRHRNLGAKFIDFGGWEMPLNYQRGVIAEHHIVRQAAGIFDVSHMGRIAIEGRDAQPFVEFLSTNKICPKGDKRATYTVWCDESGGSVDDLIVYCSDSDHYFAILNASNRDSAYTHARHYGKDFDVAITPCFEDEGILAVQGPNAKAVVEKIFPAISPLKPMQFVETEYRSENVIIAETGYTGAGGVELYLKTSLLAEIWDLLLSGGDVVPIGLGARDTLRLEMGFALYGHELSKSIAPTESVAKWTVKFDKGNFLGKEALIALERAPNKRHQYGALLSKSAIPRRGCDVYSGDIKIGSVTSGGFSPTLARGIAIVIVDTPLAVGDTIAVETHRGCAEAKITPLPFI